MDKGRRRAGRAGSPEADEDDAGFERMKSHRGRVRTTGEVRTDFEDALAGGRGELEGLVLAVHRGRLEVLLAGERVSVPVPASMTDDARGRFTVGDRISLTRAGGDDLRVRSVEPRRSEVVRADPQDPRRKRVLAANIDAAVVVCSARSPAFRPGLVDRFLIALQQGGVAPIVCLNKVDLLTTEPERREVLRRLEVYRPSGRIVATSTETAEGLADLQDAIASKTVVFVGQSGVGKSSLLNALKPWSPEGEQDGAAATGRVRRGDGKGRHTTTSSTLHELERGTRVIDTPGIRAFGLWKIEKQDLAAEFQEFAPFVSACRFRDCLHITEPECAVRGAARDGEIEALRYEAYLRILESL